MLKYCCNQKATAVVAPWLTIEDNNLLIYVKKHICLMEKVLSEYLAIVCIRQHHVQTHHLLYIKYCTK